MYYSLPLIYMVYVRPFAISMALQDVRGGRVSARKPIACGSSCAHSGLYLIMGAGVVVGRDFCVYFLETGGAALAAPLWYMW